MPVLATSLVSLKVEEPYLPPRNWESLPSQSGRFLPPTRSSASSSSSSSFVSESSLVRLALNALQGVESSLISIEQLSSAFCSEPADRTFHKIPSLWHRLSSTDALGQILRDIGCFGSLVFLLHKFVDHFTRLNLDVESAVEGQGSCKIGENEEVNNKSCYTLVNQAFAIAVRRVLEGYISGLDTLCASIELRRSSNIVDGSDHGSSRLGSLTNVVHPKITLLEVFLHTRELRTQIEALANICDLYDIALSYCASPWECLITEATTRFHGFYRGSDLLTYLYSQLQVADPTHSAMLKFLFLKTCEPYCEFIRSWMFKAELNDPHKEFIVECRSESTSFSWNKPGISPLKSVRERGGLVPCFLNGFLEPIVRAGQQLQVITKLLELCNLPASGHKNYTDLLPCWTYFSTTSPGYPSPITFSKLHIEVMIKKRDDYYRMMQEKLGDFSEKFEVFPGQVPGAISLPISYGDGDKNSIYFTLDESLLIPSTMAIDLTRDQSGSDSDDQNTEDRWFSEIDASCSSECSSTRDSLEASEVGLLDSQSTLVGPPPNYLSALRFSVASNGNCNQNLVQHSDSGYIDNNLVRQGEKADINHQWVDTKPEESTGVCEDDKFRGPLLIKSWPLGGLPRNPFCVDKKSADDDSEDPRNYSGARMEQRHLMNTDERKLFLNNISTSGSCSKHERRHDVLENCLSSKLDLMKDTKVNYPNDVLSMNPLVRCDFLRKHGNTNKRNQGKSLPWFDFSAVDDPSKTCITRIPVRVPIDFQKESHSPQTDRKSHRHANQERFDVEDPKVSSSQLSSGIKGCAEEKKSNAFGGGRWESMLRRSNNPETSAFSDRRQDSSGTFELPLDFVIDKCLLQEIHLQYPSRYFHLLEIYIFSKLAIKLLEEGFGLQEHLLALRRYHFMELADWADVFVVSLWHHKWLVTEADKRIAEIQGFLESSIQRSSCERDICKDRIFLYKRQGTMHIPPSTIGVRSFDFLRLGYRVDWPISIILTCDALTAYADVFSFLVQVKLAAYVLTDVWCSLKVKDMMDLESVHMAYLSEALRIGIQSTDRVPNDSWTKTLGINTSQNFDKELKELHKCHLRSPKHGKYGLSRFWDYLNFNLYYSDILHDSNIFSLIP
ncbi:putative protein [Arabidopsis thaliana]|uniref:Uncharacterized protein F22J12_50 n=1 Tax=Arabidopsis thaliana TaxID=3702 RepID=Q9FYD0_ARATH|nr:putative protein [Arabidopsis thaliana]